jgi:hypothetical protein
VTHLDAGALRLNAQVTGDADGGSRGAIDDAKKERIDAGARALEPAAKVVEASKRTVRQISPVARRCGAERLPELAGVPDRIERPKLDVLTEQSGARRRDGSLEAG